MDSPARLYICSQFPKVKEHLRKNDNVLPVKAQFTSKVAETINCEATKAYSYGVSLVGGEYSYSTAIGLFNNVVNIIVIVMNYIAKNASEDKTSLR